MISKRYTSQRQRTHRQPERSCHPHEAPFFLDSGEFGRADAAEIPPETALSQLVADFGGERVSVGFPDGADLDFGGIEPFGRTDGADELGMAFFDNRKLGAHIVNRVKDEVVGFEIERFDPFGGDLLRNGGHFGIVLLQPLDFQLPLVPFRMHLTVLVREVVAVEIDDRDVAHSRAV